MRNFYLIIMIFLLSFTLSAQVDSTVVTAQVDSVATASQVDSTVVNINSDETPAVLSEEDILCKKAAEDVMSIYDNWNGDRDYKILYPRIKGFVDDFYEEFPDFTLDLLKKEKLGTKLSDHENRNLVAYKGLKESVYEEISRFVSNKNFYWGYMDDELSNKLKSIAKNLGGYARGRKDELIKEQNDYVNETYVKMKKFQGQLDSLESLESLKDVNSIQKKRAELKDARSSWVDEKRQTLYDLLTYDSRRINKKVSKFLTPLEEERNIGMYDVDDEFLLSAKNSNDFDKKLKEQIKNKFYSGLVGKIGFYIQFEFKPTLRPFRVNVLIGTILFIVLFFYIFIRVKRNKETLYIRKISGLDEIDDAIGRATEMGKPIVYDSGIGGYTNIDTIASMLILRSISKKVAEFKAEIYVPTCDPIIMQISEEMVASGFLDAGYPEDHKKDNIFFLAADQFAFAAGISGILARKKPATAFHFGYYAAESLLISEAGFTAGAIQVAGTTAVAQLPFFITACDYTLIGEELYAAAAYISRDAQILTNLKLSDFAKVTIGILFILGTILLTMNSEWTFIQDIMVTR